MAGLRSPRPGPPRGGKHKDISPLLGAISGAIGSGAGAIPSSTEGIGAGADTGDSISGDISTPNAQQASGTLSPQASQPINYASLLSKPNGWQNFFSSGRAGQNYQSIIGQLANTQLAGANQQAGIHATGEETRQTQEEAGGIERLNKMHDATIAYMQKQGLPPTEYDNVKDDLFGPSLDLAKSNIETQTKHSNLTSTALDNPQAQANATAGVNAELSAPFAHNAALGTKLEPGQNYMGFPTATQPMTGSGSIPGGSSVTTGYAKDPTTGMPSTTVTTKPLAPRSGGFQLNLGQNGGANLSDLANQMAASQPTGTQEGENDESYNPLPDASSTPAISTKPSMLQSLLQTLNTPTSNSTNPFGNGNPTGALPPNPMAFSGGSGATTPPLQQLIQLLTKPTTNSSNPFSR